ncbi:MAG: AzlC family ABC transporter permease [Haloferacaceae archaeon]
MDLSWSALAQGARDISLVIPGPFSVALLASVAAAGAGLSAVQTYVMVGVTFAGASQFAALDLLTGGAAAPIVVLTALLINARFAIFSASLAPHFRERSTGWRWLLGAVLSTPASVLSLTRFAADDGVDEVSYYLGAALSLWTAWQVGTLLGLALGARVPQHAGLTFVVPLVFIGLLFSTIDDRPTAVAAAVGGVVGVAAEPLPMGLGFLVGAFVGVAVGQVADWRWGA